MDFHNLTRKELQTLCKKNKIPANITNVAMAEALNALENVVGLEEFINQLQSPEKMALESESPSINLRSASTQRKPISVDPETAQPMTRTRRTTRRTKIDQDQENKKNLMETPLVQTNRRRQPSGSVQRTRQSVRLLEKSLAELCLEKGSEKLVEMMDLSVANFEKTNDTEVSSLKNKEEMKDVVQQHENKRDDQEVNTQNFDDLHNHVSELIAKEDTVHDEMESVSASVAKFPSETGNASEVVIEAEHCLADNVYEQNSEAGNASEEVMEPENCLACKVSDESPSDTKVDEDFGCKLDSTAIDSCIEKETMILLNAVVALNNPKVDTEEQLIDVSLIEAKIPISNNDKTPEFVKQISHSYEENIPLSNLTVDSITEGNPGSDLVDVHVMEAEAFRNQMDDGDSFSSSKLGCRNSISPLEADPLLPIQFPRQTPIKSSSKKQPRNEKLIILAADNKGKIDSTEMKMESGSKENIDSTEKKVESDNKENIDSSGMKVEPKKDKVKKNKNIVDKDTMLKSLEDRSLRELTKMLKQKLKIKNDQNIGKQQQVGNTRPALQSMAENLMFAGEPKNEI